MSWGTSWVKGLTCLWRFKRRAFGKVFVALDKTSNEMVAIKRVKMVLDGNAVESESKLLKECQSRYIVHYLDVIVSESELWVCWFLSE